MTDVKNIQDKITEMLTDADNVKSQWDALTPADSDYMMLSPKPVGYHTTNEQQFIFQNLLVGYNPNSTILDLGCGRGDLYNFIKEFYREVPAYTGIDHNPLMTDIAKQKYNLDNITGAFETANLNNHDWVIACGVFTQRRCENEDADLQKLFKDIDLMYETANSVVSFNLLSPIKNKLHEGFFYVHPGLMMDLLIEKYGYVALRHNYSNEVYTITIYKF